MTIKKKVHEHMQGKQITEAAIRQRKTFKSINHSLNHLEKLNEVSLRPATIVNRPDLLDIYICSPQ